MSNSSFWQTKLHARLQGPAERALMLMHDPSGQASDGTKALPTVLFKDAVPEGIAALVNRANAWAAAADRPRWPCEETLQPSPAGQSQTHVKTVLSSVCWKKMPVLIHPLTGKKHDLNPLVPTARCDLPSRSFEHFTALVQHEADGTVDGYRTLLAYWRFGSELRGETDPEGLAALWRVLPADTRVPDHSLWDHLDLTSAFAGAFSDDPQGDAALLTLRLGPVQSFIATARSTSDLWAGSHLLSRLAWEAMKPLCEALGPDAILFPRLRGVPQVDVWLRDECGLPADLFEHAGWNDNNTDANPLFAAALPNRFVAVVPRARARDLAEQVERAVRDWLQKLGQDVVTRLVQTAGMGDAPDVPARQQMRDQLEGFPEVHWAAVPFSLIQQHDDGVHTDLDVTSLSQAMAPFFDIAPGQPVGFLASTTWQTLHKEMHWDRDTIFLAPNPGMLYPAVQDLAERALAAAKRVRSFEQTEQLGWRCSLTGETEWLTTDRAQLELPAGRRRDTLWMRVARKRPAWARPGEHLGALPALKRLWPTLFTEEVSRTVGCRDGAGRARRFVVSTHTMALAHQIDRWLVQGEEIEPALREALARHGGETVALPRRLIQRHGARHAALDVAQRLPALLEAATAATDEGDDHQSDVLRRLVERTLGGEAARLETYYSLLLLDGDRMGKWLGGGDDHAISYRDSFHPQVRDRFDIQASKVPSLHAYGACKRAVSPNRHLAISAALNDFSLTVAPHVIEAEYLGRLIYAGGDDVLAMLPVADLLPAMQRLRAAYAGHDLSGESADRSGLTLKNGYALLGSRLMCMMGDKATASCGAVVAHHQAPLGAVMRALREAEQRAKNEGGRDAFSLSVIKRSGGALTLTAKWGVLGETVALLHELRRFLAADGVSRRAVYNSLEWLKDLPPHQPQMLATLLAYQFDRQADQAARARHDVSGLARRLAALTFDDAQHPVTRHQPHHLDWLANFMSVAEFLARQTRETH